MRDSKEETLALLRLCLCENVGSGVVHVLIDKFGSAQDALKAPSRQLGIGGKIPGAAVRGIKTGPPEGALEKELELLERHGVRLVPFFSDDYPFPLKHLEADFPPLLWIKGTYMRQDVLAVAMVGSRRCSHYGKEQARRLAASLTGMGFTIISGLARGIDAAAHRGTLRAGGRTIAVVGSGLANIYPEDHAGLAQEISNDGALISELPMMTPPRAGNFPPRNRLISALSLGVLVVEAGARSGSLITASWAGQQGKQVFAVPGNVDSPTSHGCHRLIRNGAILAETAEDVVDGLGPLGEPLDLPGRTPTAEESRTVRDARVMALNGRERQIFDLLSSAPAPMDSLIAQMGLPASMVSSTLLTLEIKGLARKLPGNRYVRN